MYRIFTASWLTIRYAPGMLGNHGLVDILHPVNHHLLDISTVIEFETNFDRFSRMA